MDKPRRSDLPPTLREREQTMQAAMRMLVKLFQNFPGSNGEGVGIALLTFDLGEGGAMSYVSNARRADMIVAMRELIERLEMGTDDTAGRGEG